MATQLRLYTIKPGRVDAFLEAWRAGVPRLRRAHGFSLEAAWLAREERRFSWLMSYPGDREAFARADRVYYESPERRSLSPDPADELEATERFFVEPVELP